MGEIMRLREVDTNNADFAAVSDAVMAGDIFVVHGVLSEMEAASAVKAAISWTRMVPPFDTKGGTASPEAHQNFHRVDNNPPLSKTKHIFHTLNFESLRHLTDGIRENIETVFTRMKEIDNSLTEPRGDFDGPRAGQPNFHPQIIHYPRGGGFFDRHEHSILPQKIGLIASLTKKGTHFSSGGTHFWNGSEMIDAEPAQTIGSVTLFRFDLPHAVSQVDPENDLEFGAHSGRWVAVLPFR
jgi:hypothetical protein